MSKVKLIKIFLLTEYVTNAASYESDNEDLPPFPVPEYSPTPPL